MRLQRRHTVPTTHLQGVLQENAPALNHADTKEDVASHDFTRLGPCPTVWLTRTERTGMIRCLTAENVSRDKRATHTSAHCGSRHHHEALCFTTTYAVRVGIASNRALHEQWAQCGSHGHGGTTPLSRVSHHATRPSSTEHVIVVRSRANTRRYASDTCACTVRWTRRTLAVTLEKGQLVHEPGERLKAYAFGLVPQPGGQHPHLVGSTATNLFAKRNKCAKRDLQPHVCSTLRIKAPACCMRVKTPYTVHISSRETSVLTKEALTNLS